MIVEEVVALIAAQILSRTIASSACRCVGHRKRQSEKQYLIRRLEGSD